MMNMKIAKFMSSFTTKSYPIRLTLTLPNLTAFTVITLDKKAQMNFFTIVPELKWGKRNFISAKKSGKISLKEDRDVSFYRFKKFFKRNCLSKYNKK